MDEQLRQLVDFAQKSKGLDDHSRLKLMLLAIGAKPATFFTLKISPENIDEKSHLEKHLRACRIPYIAGKARAYEEITEIKGNKIKWEIKGSWYGYDAFADRKHIQLFEKYLSLVKKQKHEQADRTAGMLYDYPKCCVEHYINEHKPGFLRKNYTHYSYYAHLHAVERALPLLMHTACSAKCSASKKMNAKYAIMLKKYAPEFWKQFSPARKTSTSLVIDTESELLQDTIYGSLDKKPVFARKDGHEYTLITMKKINGRHYLLNHLTKKTFERGTIMPAKITMQYNYADVKLGKPKKTIKNLHHERHFVLL
jgi:hypothetical protein